MKCLCSSILSKIILVTLSVRVWIEIFFYMFSYSFGHVTLSVRVWIEIICKPNLLPLG